jgi:hypothetical protein
MMQGLALLSEQAREDARFNYVTLDGSGGAPAAIPG